MGGSVFHPLIKMKEDTTAIGGVWGGTPRLIRLARLCRAGGDFCGGDAVRGAKVHPNKAGSEMSLCDFSIRYCSSRMALPLPRYSNSPLRGFACPPYFIRKYK